MLKEQVLCIMEKNIGKRITGGELAKILNVSRTAIWKSINALKADGINITAFPNGGYVLNSKSDILLAAEIENRLNTILIGRKISILPSVASTNTQLKQEASKNSSLPSGYTLIANEQLNGRGRMGRSFFSPKDSGIYLSIFLRPSMLLTDISIITVIAALSVKYAIYDICKLNVSIKWVNDIFYNGKKLCGILTEASIDGELSKINYIICGIGINVGTKKETFPKDVRLVAASIRSFAKKEFSRNQLISAILNHFEKLYFDLMHGKKQKIISEYKSSLFMLGNTVTVSQGSDCYTALAIDIDDEAHLIVRLNSGELRTLIGGEISVRPIEN